jgi:glutamate N-acetyltransferase/amino-acid N-acetyltransferase
VSDPGTRTSPVFFRSRWVDVPDGVVQAGGGLPGGFRAAGVAAGLKPSGNPDVGLLVCNAPNATSAARFTRSGVLAAPVLVCRQRARLDGLRAVVANSGCANAATGGRGFDDADFSAAIMTTDAFEKRATLDVTLPSGGSVRLSAQAKGAGMIQPSFATMLCFVQTDAALSAETADLLLGVTVKRSFDRISVDGQLSTNDTALLICSGTSGVAIEPQTPDELAFGKALDSLLRQLALEIVRDGEGAARVGRVVARGSDGTAVERAARAVANSPLVKAALHGGDPNWGRIAQAVGGALPDTAPLALDIAIAGVTVCARGAAVPFDLDALNAAVAVEEVDYEVRLPGEGFETEVFFSDLSHAYVTVNADYTT